MKVFRIICVGISLAGLLFLFSGCGQSDISAYGSGGGFGSGGGASPDPANITVILTPSAIGNPPSTTTVDATVTDAFSNPLAGITVDFSASPGGTGTFSAASAVTDAAGVATVTFDPSVSDQILTIVASVTLTGGGTINNSANLQVGTPVVIPDNATITISPVSIDIQQQAAVTVDVTSGGTPAPGFDVDITITGNPGLGSFDPVVDLDTVTGTTDVNGQVTVTFYADITSGSVTIEAVVDVLPVGSGVEDITTSPGQLLITSQPANIVLTAAPNPITTSGTSSVTADVTNGAGQPVPDGTTVNFSIISIPIIGSIASTATTVGGQATVTYSAGTSAGTAQIEATSGPATSNSVIITISAAAAGSIEFVSATPNIIGIQGSGVQDTSVVTFLVKDVNGAPKANESVDFVLAVGPTGATLQNISDSSGTDGIVQTILQADLVAGPARIVASLTSDPTITTSSGNISIGGGVPSATHFDLSATRINLEGLACLGVTSTISVFLADRFSNYNVLEGTSVSFAAEAGAIDTSNVTDATGVTSVTIRTQAPDPINVAPIGGEPSYTYGGNEYNPRDGYVSVLVMTTGEETFEDDNANGYYDSPPDTFASYDLGEPFIDNDDDGTRDPGELFFDWPAGVTGNTIGQRDGVNGVWDSQIPIYGTVTLLFTGTPHVADTTVDPRILTSRVENGNAYPNEYDDVTIPPGGTHDFYVYVTDINMNPLIPGTVVTVSTTEGTVEVFPSNPFTIGTEGTVGLVATLTNDITGSIEENATLRVTVDWPGQCGSVTRIFKFDGDINLTPPSPPAAPTGVNAVAGGAAGEIDISWNNSTGATSYNLYWGTASGATTNLVSGVTSPHTQGGFTPGTTYYFAVTAVGAGGESAKSSEVSAVAP